MAFPALFVAEPLAAKKTPTVAEMVPKLLTVPHP
jgi:hypothetical protein